MSKNNINTMLARTVRQQVTRATVSYMAKRPVAGEKKIKVTKKTM